MNKQTLILQYQQTTNVQNSRSLDFCNLPINRWQKSRKGQNMMLGIIIVAIIIIIFIAISPGTGKMFGLFRNVTSPFDDTCCCDKTLANCEIKTQQECKQTIQPIETCTQRGIK